MVHLIYHPLKTSSLSDPVFDRLTDLLSHYKTAFQSLRCCLVLFCIHPRHPAFLLTIYSIVIIEIKITRILNNNLNPHQHMATHQV